MSTQMIASADVSLQVRVTGNQSGPVVVLVHGFPDTQQVWDRVVPLLEPDFRVVTYDVRGAGASTAPSSRSGYRMSKLVGDLVAVIEHAVPAGGPVHLMGHDWGSVQLWGAVMRADSDPRLSGRIASYTSISGPGLDLFGHFLRSGLTNRRLVAVGRQIAHSWYVLAFQTPWLPELVARRFGDRIRTGLTRSQHLDESHWGDTFEDDFSHGINLYRANGLSFRRGTTSVPVQLIVPTKDAFLSAAIYADVAEFAPDVRRVDVVAGHWVIQTQPSLVADTLRGFIEEIEDRGRDRQQA
ncbi:alpha/beta fold hydrolase [Aeromicrobium sp.]|uniref:alpha/beta fold hydrolase n=1 Tax=Aeromicrobium sp. TaxID=1871063 RepID=UPI0019BFB35E|nr:alpha/beta fold hydrolase [Aeromicrobium sp.]MBC7631202.1 alpha/beta fold hydrolase [Aeromicrobium sp.]